MTIAAPAHTVSSASQAQKILFDEPSDDSELRKVAGEIAALNRDSIMIETILKSPRGARATRFNSYDPSDFQYLSTVSNQQGKSKGYYAYIAVMIAGGWIPLISSFAFGIIPVTTAILVCGGGSLILGSLLKSCIQKKASAWALDKNIIQDLEKRQKKASERLESLKARELELYRRGMKTKGDGNDRFSITSGEDRTIVMDDQIIDIDGVKLEVKSSQGGEKGIISHAGALFHPDRPPRLK